MKLQRFHLHGLRVVPELYHERGDPSASCCYSPHLEFTTQETSVIKTQLTSCLLGLTLKQECLACCHTHWDSAVHPAGPWSEQVGLGAVQPLLFRDRGMGGCVDKRACLCPHCRRCCSRSSASQMAQNPTPQRFHFSRCLVISSFREHTHRGGFPFI